MILDLPNMTDWARLLKKTDGASPAFIKQLVRKAALIAVERLDDDDVEISSEPLKISDEVLLAEQTLS